MRGRVDLLEFIYLQLFEMLSSVGAGAFETLFGRYRGLERHGSLVRNRFQTLIVSTFCVRGSMSVFKNWYFKNGFCDRRSRFYKPLSLQIIIFFISKKVQNHFTLMKLCIYMCVCVKILKIDGVSISIFNQLMNKIWTLQGKKQNQRSIAKVRGGVHLVGLFYVFWCADNEYLGQDCQNLPEY